MNTKVLICILFAITLVNAQATQREVIEVVNFARTNPMAVAGILTNRITSTSAKGITGDENCW